MRARTQTYTVSLILRNSDDEEAFIGEAFPKEGYGWFIVFIYVFVLPAPTIYSFCMNSKQQTKADGDMASGMFDNPLAPDSLVGDEMSQATDRDIDLGAATLTDQPAISLPKIAKMQREKKETQVEVEALRTEVVALRAQNNALAAAVPVSGEVGATSGGGTALDGDATGPSAEPATAKYTPYVPPEPVETDPAKIEIKALKGILDDESLAEQLREAAKKNIEVLTTTRMLESEAMVEGLNRSARYKKTVAAVAWKAPEVQREEFRVWLGENRSALLCSALLCSLLSCSALQSCCCCCCCCCCIMI